MKTPVRTCAGCGARRPKSEMIRIGTGAGEGPAISSARKTPGRGAYLCPDSKCLYRARKNGGIGRAVNSKVPERLYEELEIEIESRRKVSVG